MSDTPRSTPPAASVDPDLATYELRVRTHLDPHWADSLHATRFDHNLDGTTTIHTAPIDHARLHGVLVRLFDIGGALLHLERHTKTPVAETSPTPTPTPAASPTPSSSGVTECSSGTSCSE